MKLSSAMILKNIFPLVVTPRMFSTQYKFINVDPNGRNGIANVILNRPPVNSMNLKLLQELNHAIDAFKNTQIKGVVISSSSDKVFSAGLDFSEIQNATKGAFYNFWKTLQDSWIGLYRSPFPVGALVTGHAPAGGCVLALCCDYIVMVENATIGLNESRVGIPLPPWIGLITGNRIGKAKAGLAITSGKLFTTQEAVNIGLVDEMARNREEAWGKMHAFFEEYADVSNFATSISKQNHRKTDIEFMEKTRESDLEFMVDHVLQPEFQQHLEAYIKKVKSRST